MAIRGICYRLRRRKSRACAGTARPYIRGMARRRSQAPDPTPVRPAAREAGAGYLTGQLLVAMPCLTEPPFAGSVIYLCAHNAEGAMGIVVNQGLEQPGFDDLLQQLDIEPVPPARRIALCAGGPVDAARGFVLHSGDWNGDGSLRVDDDVTLTASRDILKVIAAGGGPREGVLALGYTGWGAGQLEREFQQNAWLSVPARPALLFGARHGGKWREALATLKIDPLALSGVAGRA